MTRLYNKTSVSFPVSVTYILVVRMTVVHLSQQEMLVKCQIMKGGEPVRKCEITSVIYN